MQLRAFEKGKHRPIYFRPVRLHHIKHESRGVVPIRVHDTQHRVIAICDELDLHPALEDSVGIVQDSVDRMRCMPTSSGVESRIARTNRTPFIWDRMARGRAPEQGSGMP